MTVELAKVRKEAADARGKSRDAAREEAATAAEKAMGEKIAKALGIKIGDEPPSVDVLQASIAERDAQIVTMQVDAELGTAIAAAGANAATLIPYLRGTKALDGLDPAKKDFAETVTALVATTVEAHWHVHVVSSKPSHAGVVNDSGDVLGFGRPDTVNNYDHIPKVNGVPGPDPNIGIWLRHDIGEVTCGSYACSWYTGTGSPGGTQFDAISVWMEELGHAQGDLPPQPG